MVWLFAIEVICGWQLLKGKRYVLISLLDNAPKYLVGVLSKRDLKIQIIFKDYTILFSKVLVIDPDNGKLLKSIDFGHLADRITSVAFGGKYGVFFL